MRFEVRGFAPCHKLYDQQTEKNSNSRPIFKLNNKQNKWKLVKNISLSKLFFFLEKKSSANKEWNCHHLSSLLYVTIAQYFPFLTENLKLLLFKVLLNCPFLPSYVLKFLAKVIIAFIFIKQCHCFNALHFQSLASFWVLSLSSYISLFCVRACLTLNGNYNNEKILCNSQFRKMEKFNGLRPSQCRIWNITLLLHFFRFHFHHGGTKTDASNWFSQFRHVFRLNSDLVWFEIVYLLFFNM